MNSRYRGTWDSLHGQGTRAEIHVRVLLWPAALALALDLDHKGAGRSDYGGTVPCTAHALARNGLFRPLTEAAGPGDALEFSLGSPR